MQDVSPPRVVVFPHDDLAFRAHVDSAVERSAREDPAKLETYLSDAYPDVRVRERTGLADLGGDRAWYVYRDGSLISPIDEDWWKSADLAEFRIDGSGTYVSVNATAAELLGRDIDSIAGQRVGSFTRHEAVDDAGLRAFAVLAEQGVLESTALVVRPDGEEVAVRYRLTGSPKDGYRMVMVRR